jgi:hypothetical protein
VRGALRLVASIITVLAASLWAASATKTRSNTPARLQRTKRLYRVLCGPQTAGASRHINPLRITLDDLTAASGWLPHTTRAALTRLRQRGYDVRLAGAGTRRAYAASRRPATAAGPGARSSASSAA